MTRKLNIDKAYNDTVDRKPAGNSGFAKKRVQWLIENSTSHLLWCWVDSFELRNPLLRKAAKRCAPPKLATMSRIGYFLIFFFQLPCLLRDNSLIL